MRVLFWCDAFWPLIGGVEVLAARLVEALKARGYELAVVTRREPNLRERDEFHGIPVHRLEFLEARVGRDFERWATLRAQVATIKREFRPDVVHVYHVTHDVLFHLVTAAAHPAPTLCTVHGAFADSELTGDTVLGRTLRAADWTTACAGAALAELHRQVPETVGRSSVIWNGLDAPALLPTPLPDAPQLLCIGRIGSVEEKGFDVAIAAMRLLRDRFPALRLRIAGDGAARPALEAIARATGVSDQVEFLGFVHPDRIPALINEASALLMPSRVAEGFGLVALQAAQMARPVVASRVGGVPEVVADGETGLLVPPDDAIALANAVAQLLGDPPRATRMGEAGRARAAARFSWTGHVDAYDALLRRMASPAHVASPDKAGIA